MTGRGRPRKAKSSDTKCEKSPTRAEETKPRRPGKAVKEEKQNGTTTKVQTPKKRQQEKLKQEEKLSVQSIPGEKTTKHFKEIGKLQKTPTDDSKATVPVTKAKTCAGRVKKELVLPNYTAIDPVKIAKPKTCGTEKTTKTQPEIPEGTTKASPTTKQAKPCRVKAKSPDQIAREKKTTQPETPKQDKCIGKAKVNAILNTTLEKLKIKRNERSDAAKVVNNIVDKIMDHLRTNSDCFNEVKDPLRTGSYYENLKISNPDEFDVMLPIPVDRVEIEPFGDNGAFYSVALKRGKSLLTKFQQETGILSASKMLKEFREDVKKCVKTFKEWEVTKKKKGCPAVTLTTKVNKVTISLDVVLCLVVKSNWPAFTKDGFAVEGWLGTKVKKLHKYTPYYLVPKYEGSGTAESNEVLAKDVWRVSFSHIEKAILMNHGSEKTCCEAAGARCCRKDCLKLLKHLLSLLKERDSFDKFCSYHAKTTLLHACCSRTKDTDWQTQSLSHCFQKLLEDFEGHLEKGELSNFFIPKQNLLSGPSKERCRSLARCIRNERNNGFPIFK